MSRHPAWKKVEERVAAFIDTRRTPLSGGNSGHTRSDTLHPDIYAEIKHGAGCPRSWSGVLDLFESTEELAAAEHKVALLVLHRNRGAKVEEYDAYLRVWVDTGAGTKRSLVVCIPLGEAKKLLMAQLSATSTA